MKKLGGQRCTEETENRTMTSDRTKQERGGYANRSREGRALLCNPISSELNSSLLSIMYACRYRRPLHIHLCQHAGGLIHSRECFSPIPDKMPK